jgi:ABC-2 type transport system ATP-binding protein
MAALDPIAREDFMTTVMRAVAENGVSVVLSSHVLAELGRVADYLVVVSHGRIQLAGEVEELLATHRLLTGPSSGSEQYPREWGLVHGTTAGSQAHLLVRSESRSEPVAPGWEARAVTLEELTMAYLREPGTAAFSVSVSGRGEAPEETR